MVIPREDGEEIAATMRLAMADAGIAASQIDYINAHATSTTIGDAVEAKAIRQVFRSRADKIAVSATKSLIGHTLGAAGAIGGVATVLGIHTGSGLRLAGPQCLRAGTERQGSATQRVRVW